MKQTEIYCIKNRAELDNGAKVGIKNCERHWVPVRFKTVERYRIIPECQLALAILTRKYSLRRKLWPVRPIYPASKHSGPNSVEIDRNVYERECLNVWQQYRILCIRSLVSARVNLSKMLQISAGSQANQWHDVSWILPALFKRSPFSPTKQRISLPSVETNCQSIFIFVYSFRVSKYTRDALNVNTQTKYTKTHRSIKTLDNTCNLSRLMFYAKI